MRTKWEEDHWGRRDIRYVRLDSPDGKTYDDDPEPTMIGHKSQYHDRWAYNRIDRLTDQGLQKLVTRRRELQEEERQDDYWYIVLNKIIEYGKNVTGQYVNPHNGKVGTYTLAPSKTGSKDSILLGSRDDLETVEDNKLILFYSKRQRRHFFRARLLRRIEELLMIAARDRLPALPQEQRFPVKKMGKATIFGVDLLFTAKEIYVRDSRTEGHYDHYWELFYISETDDTEFFEV